MGRRQRPVAGIRTGDRVELDRSYYPMHDLLPPGSRGTVIKTGSGHSIGVFVDVMWDRGFPFFLQPYQGDEFHRVEEE